MKISELLRETDIGAQMAKDNELMVNAMRQRWEAEQRANQPAPTPAAPAAPPEVQVTPDMIAKHPQYKAWYDKYLAQELPNSLNKNSAEAQAKKYADSKIGSLIRQGQ